MSTNRPQINTWEYYKNHLPALAAKEDLRDSIVLKRYHSVLGRVQRFFFVYYVQFRLLFADFVVTRNDFPYSRVLHDIPGLSQYIIWYRTNVPEMQLVNGILTIGDRYRFGGVQDVFSYENAIQAKSIKTISHRQLFILFGTL